jgi:hypothetical protein
MRNIALLVFIFCSSCSALNILEGPDDFCLLMHSRLRSDFDEAISREISKEPPNGALTKPYSRQEWDKYWNHRIYNVWDIGQDDCGGKYRGPSGSELIREAIKKRRDADLPEIYLEPRNSEMKF